MVPKRCKVLFNKNRSLIIERFYYWISYNSGGVLMEKIITYDDWQLNSSQSSDFYVNAPAANMCDASLGLAADV